MNFKSRPESTRTHQCNGHTDLLVAITTETDAPRTWELLVFEHEESEVAVLCGLRGGRREEVSMICRNVIFAIYHLAKFRQDCDSSPSYIVSRLKTHMRYFIYDFDSILMVRTKLLNLNWQYFPRKIVVIFETFIEVKTAEILKMFVVRGLFNGSVPRNKLFYWQSYLTWNSGRLARPPLLHSTSLCIKDK